MNRQALYTALSVLVCALLVWVYYILTVEVEREVKTGFIGKARQNPYLAAQRYNEEYEIFVESRRAIDYRNLDNFDTLFIPVEALPPTQEHILHIENWVRRGGTLLTGFTSAVTHNHLNQNQKQFLGIESIEESSFASDGEAECEVSYDDELYHIKANSYFDLTFHRHSNIQNFKNKFIMASSHLGQGSIVIVSDLNQFNNTNLKESQNVEFLDVLTFNTGYMMIVYLGEFPSAWDWLLDNAQFNHVVAH
jgi:hypothetical protein